MTPDPELLASFARTNSGDAFAELVRRHINLVYSAALRQLNGDTYLAQDVAQTVFADLARKAESLSQRQSLTGWLYASAHFAAAKIIRTETRRRDREEKFMRDPGHEPTPDAEWESLHPALDDAMHELGESDREAILLRYFENQPFAAVGVKLGLGENAARMRVERALEKLRDAFAKRGVVTTSTLAAAISAHAVQLAPAGLAATISATAITAAAVSTATAVALTKSFTMISFHKAIIGATFAALVGTGIYAAHQNKLFHKQVQASQDEQGQLSEQIRQLLGERDEARSQLAGFLADDFGSNKNSNEIELLKLRGEVSSLQNEANTPEEKALRELARKVGLLKLRFKQHPEQNIPEMQFATENDWVFAAMCNLNTESDYRMLLGSMRSMVKSKFCGIVFTALRQYINANNGQFPTDLSQLSPYFVPQIQDDVLQRYEIVPAASFTKLSLRGNMVIAEKEQPVDEGYDDRYIVGRFGVTSTVFKSPDPDDQQYRLQIDSINKAYADANNGQTPGNPLELTPFATTSDQKVAQRTAVQLFQVTNSGSAPNQ